MKRYSHGTAGIIWMSKDVMTSDHPLNDETRKPQSLEDLARMHRR